MEILAGFALASLLGWLYLLLGHGRFWRTDQRLPHAPDPDRWPEIIAVVPARNEASMLPRTLPALLAQRYPGVLRVIVVDDDSTDGTGELAAMLPGSAGDGARLTVIEGVPTPPGWAGKVWAMHQGLSLADGEAFVLFCDADVALGPDVLARLVRAAEGRGLDLVSQMAELHAGTPWERVIVPAFVYFFAQLYPFRWVNRPVRRTAAAAGGCMLVRTASLRSAGGLEAMRDALIDDVTLARSLAGRPGGARLWLGHGGPGVTSVRPYPRLGDLWDMVARSASTQLRHSFPLVVATVAGMLLLYVVPPVAAVSGLTTAGIAGWSASWVGAVAGLAAWAVMAATYVPTLRPYGLGRARALTLPGVATLYSAMTVDSYRRHLRGMGGAWKGRTAP
ncbi:MAG TPA: glycosyltransferase [Actinomycetota bacterium]|nr:glycosyltransferase [Actinomycetota bacterium]